jgi:hypothetical protein
VKQRVKTMMGCNYIKRLIDEADKSDLLPFEASEHIGSCGDCERFADDRMKLRGLLASESRVTAPMNFDAMLKARLAEAKGRSAFSWLSSPGYMRLGTATAGLVLMIFAAQYAGLFSDRSNQSTESRAAVSVPPTSPTGPPTAPPTFQTTPPISGAAQVAIAGAASRPRQYYPQNLRAGRTDVAVRGGTAPGAYFTAEDGGVVLVRGRNGDMDVPMPTVSVGAQPLLYVSAGQRAVRNAGNSF